MSVAAVVHGESARRALAHVNTGIRRAAELALREAVEVTKAAARATTDYHDRSGGTRASVKAEVAGLRGFVEAGGATSFIEHGTVPHIISAHGKALRFVVGGQVLFRKWVRHPGTKPHPFMHQAAIAGAIAAEHAAQHWVSEAISREG